MRRLLLLALLVCAACTPTLDPIGGAAYYGAQVTEIARVESTQIAAMPVTQSYLEAEYAKSLTATALPPQQTATQQALQLADFVITERWDNRTATVVAQTVAYSQTAVVMTLRASDAQAQIAENNASIARSTTSTSAFEFACYGSVGVFVLGLLVLLFIAAPEVKKVTEKISEQTQKRIEFDTAMRAYKETQKVANPDGGNEFLLTSAGPMRRIVAPIAEQKAARVSRDDQVRAALKNYVTACVDLARQGVRQPYSRANACKHAIVSHPATGDWWQLGHDRTVKMLRAMKVLDNTGAGGETVLIVGVGYYARVIDLTPLPNLPFDPIPAVKITVAGWQLSQV